MNEHEFTLHSADKYKDGSPIMSEPDTASSYPFPKSNQLDPEFCEFGTCPYYGKFCDHTLQDKHGCAYLPHTPEANVKYLEQIFTEFAKVQDDIIADYDEKLKDHYERITINEGNIDAISSDVEDLQRKVAAIYQFLNSVALSTFFEIMESLKKVEKENIHNGSNFCGNCEHLNKSRAEDGIYACELSYDIVDPDDSSCPMFEPPF